MEDINSLLEIERLEQARMKRKSKSQSRRNKKEAHDESSMVHDISEQLMGDVVKNVMARVTGSNHCFNCGCANDTTDDDGASTWATSTAKSVATSITGSVMDKSSVASSIMSCMDKSLDGEYSTSVEDDWTDTSSLTDSKVYRPRKFFRNKIFKRNNGTSEKYSKKPRKVFGLKERYEC